MAMLASTSSSGSSKIRVITSTTSPRFRALTRDGVD
jgi:hypothetical protein